MLFWTAVFGAVLGWLGADFEGHGFFVGGVIGWIVGWGLRQVIRAEVKAATAALLAQLEARPSAAVNNSFGRQSVFEEELPAEPVAQEIVEEYRPQAAVPPREAIAAQGVPSFAKRDAEPVKVDPATQAFSAVFNGARNWLLGGNTIVRVGLVVLFIGLSFLASYAAAAGFFPIEMRLALVALFGAGLLAFGFRTRLQRPAFGLALQGGGVATIYMTLFATAKLVDGFPLLGAFGLMLLVCALGCALALLQRSQALAVTAFAGGFAVPLLLSTGRGDVVALFAYYTLLNLAILFIAWQRSWRALNLVGFFSTFAILTLLVMAGFETTQFVAHQAFLIISVLIYVATAVLYGANTPLKLESPSGNGLFDKLGSKFSNAVDTTLLFGTALIGFGLQVGLVGDREFGSAFSALAFGALYIGVAALIARRQPDTSRVMTEAMLAIGVGFVTLAIPLALGARWTSAAWALEGAGAFWVGMRQARWLPRLFGLVLQGVGALVYFVWMGPNVASMPLANPAFMGAMLIALAGLATAWWLRQDLAHSQSRFALYYVSIERMLGKPAFLIGFGFWCLAWTLEIGRTLPMPMAEGYRVSVFPRDIQILLTMATFVISAWGFGILGRRQQWPVAIWPSAASIVALVLGFLTSLVLGSHIVEIPAILIWIIAIGVHGRMLFANDCDSSKVIAQPLLVGTHVGGVWLATAMLADCLWLAIDKAGLWDTSWAGVSFLAAGVAVLLGLTFLATRKMALKQVGGDKTSLAWPLNPHVVAYGWLATLPIVAFVVLGAFVTALFASGDADPLPYVPLLNPVDLMVALAIASVVLWRRTVIESDIASQGAIALKGRSSKAVLALLAFVAINTAWLRATHNLLGIEWGMGTLFGSFIVQTGFAILWTVLALPLMVIAHRRANRGLWLAGAGLLALTVVKLVLVDLNNTDGGARIIAFIGVGILMLVVGYLAPLPPRIVAPPAQAKDDAASEGAPS